MTTMPFAMINDLLYYNWFWSLVSQNINRVKH